MRNLTIFLKNKQVDDDIRFKLENSRKNWLILDSDDLLNQYDDQPEFLKFGVKIDHSSQSNIEVNEKIDLNLYENLKDEPGQNSFNELYEKTKLQSQPIVGEYEKRKVKYINPFNKSPKTNNNRMPIHPVSQLENIAKMTSESSEPKNKDVKIDIIMKAVEDRGSA